jgi:hypothetical protein
MSTTAPLKEMTQTRLTAHLSESDPPLDAAPGGLGEHLSAGLEQRTQPVR